MRTMDAQSVARVIAAELREYPWRWTQGVYARDAQDEEVEHDSAAAVCWCLHGFIRHVLQLPASGEFTPTAILSAFEQAAVGKSYDPVTSAEVAFVDWQDAKGRTVADIIAVCDLVAAS
jgi:hypothetical protein